MTRRVSVYIDYQNVHMSGHEMWCDRYDAPENCLPHPLRLAEMLVERRKGGGDLEAVHVYRGRPDPRKQVTLASANDKQKQAWEMSPLVQVHRRPLRYPADWGDPGAERAREKGVDVALAIDMVRHAITGQFDAAILVSRDTDLVPALEAIRELSGPHVEVATWEGSSRLRLEGPLWCHMLSEEDWVNVRDSGFYGPNPPYRGPRIKR